MRSIRASLCCFQTVRTTPPNPDCQVLSLPRKPDGVIRIAHQGGDIGVVFIQDQT